MTTLLPTLYIYVGEAAALFGALVLFALHSLLPVLCALSLSPFATARRQIWLGSHRIMKIAVIGWGNLGHYLVEEAAKLPAVEVLAIWDQYTANDAQLLNIPLFSIEDFSETFLPISGDVDLVVEVAHPTVTKNYGPLIVAHCDYLIGSPTALADDPTLKSLQGKKGNVWIPAGAFWGGEDIRRMADMDTLKNLTVTMAKHPSCFKLESPLREINDSVREKAVVLYDGAVRQLCQLAPNNVNTMAAACVAAHNLGFDSVRARLISDPELADAHVVTVEVESVSGLLVRTERRNPAKLNAVTGKATYASFLSSLKCVLQAKGLMGSSSGFGGEVRLC